MVMRLYLCYLILLFPATSLAQSPDGTQADSSLASIRAFVQISDDIATSGQIGVRHIGTIKDSGYDLIVNLAPARKQMNGEEAFAAVEAGLAYVQIPVDFRNPALRDLEFFFRIMEANKDRKVYVHCFANMRVSSFMYLYRVIRLGVSPEEAKGDLNKVWEPNEDWKAFIEKALETYRY